MQLSVLVVVEARPGQSIDELLRVFTKKTLQAGLIKEVRRHSYYVKPSERRRIKSSQARRKAAKKVRNERLLDQYNLSKQFNR